MYDVALKQYGGVPMRVRGGFPSLRQVGGYGEALTRIKCVFDPNNILSPNMGLFEDMEKYGRPPTAKLCANLRRLAGYAIFKARSSG